MLPQRFLPKDGHGFVWRKVVAVILQHRQIQSRNKPVRRVPCREINLLVFQGASEQAEVHDARRSGKAQAIGCGQAFVTVWALHELITETGVPLRRVGGSLRDGLQAEAAGILATNFNRESIVESER